MAVFEGSLLLRWLLLLPLLLLLLLPLGPASVVTCLANVVSAEKQPLRSELSTRVPARIRDAKVVTGCMLSKAPVAGYAPWMIISIDSSSEGLSRTCEARARQRSTYSLNGSCGLCLVETVDILFWHFSFIDTPLGSATWEYRLALKLVSFRSHLQEGAICRYPILALPSSS